MGSQGCLWRGKGEREEGRDGMERKDLMFSYETLHHFMFLTLQLKLNRVMVTDSQCLHMGGKKACNTQPTLTHVAYTNVTPTLSEAERLWLHYLL